MTPEIERDPITTITEADIPEDRLINRILSTVAAWAAEKQEDA